MVTVTLLCVYVLGLVLLWAIYRLIDYGLEWCGKKTMHEELREWRAESYERFRKRIAELAN